MYKRIGTYKGDVDFLLSQASRVGMHPSGSGYTCSPRDQTKELYLPLVKDVFPGNCTGLFLAIIWPQGNIPPHGASGIGEVIADGSMRYHLILKTNPKCWNMHDGDWQQLEERGIYEFDPRKVHASINWGKEWRVHLVVDIDGGMKNG
jgi:hypothetical protein